MIDNRQFQMALRRLRQFSTKLDLPKSELDIDQTIDKTCNNGGYLQIEMMKPRKNAVKLLLLMDSGGTMIPYTRLMNDLFQPVNKSNHFKDVKVYYFHNCIYSKLYKTPEVRTATGLTRSGCSAMLAAIIKSSSWGRGDGAGGALFKHRQLQERSKRRLVRF